MKNRFVLLSGVVFLLSASALHARGQHSSIIETIAGGDSTGMTGTEFSLSSISGLATDAVGNTYFSTQSLNRVYRLGVDGLVTVFAGTGAPGKHQDDVPAASTPVTAPYSIAVDGTGNLYIAALNILFRVDSATGVLSTVFRTPYHQPGSPNVIQGIQQMVIGPDGNLYITDGVRIQSYSFASGSVSLLAGNGTFGPTKTGGPATSTPLSTGSLAVAADGTLYFSTSEPTVYYVQRDGKLASLNLQPDRNGPPLGEYDVPHALALDGLGHLFVTQGNRSRILRVTLKTGQVSVYAGTGAQGFNGDGIIASQANLSAPINLTCDVAGNLTFSEINRIRRADASSNLISTVVGNGLPATDGGTVAAPRATLSEPAYAVPAPDGSIYVTSSFSNRLLRISPDKSISTLVGGADWITTTSKPGPALQVALSYPQAIWIADGDLFFSDQSNRVVRRFATTTGEVTNFATSPRKGNSFGQVLSQTAALVADQEFFYLSDPDDDRVWRLSKQDGTLESYAGLGSELFHDSVPGPISARLVEPSGLALDSSRNLYIADGRLLGQQGRILRVNAADRRMTTVLAGLQHPTSLAFRSPTVLCFSETGANRVRCLDLTTHKTFLIAGTGMAGYGGDGGPAGCAKLNRPLGISFDQSQNLYIADTGNQRIRRVRLGRELGQCPN